MNTQNTQAEDTHAADETEIRSLYRQLLDGWNERDGDAMAAIFTEDGDVVGFDGSQVAGRGAIAAEQNRIFADHMTAVYVGKVRGVRFLAEGAAVLYAVAGMVLRGESEIRPERNAIQTVVAAKHDGQWRIVLFQNTLAQFHGRPELVEKMTKELQEEMKKE